MERNDRAMTPEQLQAHLISDSNGITQVDVAKLKSTNENPQFIKRQQDILKQKLGIHMDATVLTEMNQDFVDKIVIPWTKNRMDIVNANYQELCGDYFATNTKERFRKQFAAIDILKDEAKKAGEEGDKKSADDLSAAAQEMEANLIIPPIANLPTYMQHWDRILMRRTVNIEQIRRGEPIRYQYPLETKMAWEVDPNGDIHEIQIITSKETITERWLKTGTYTIQFEDALADEALQFITLRAGMSEENNRYIDWLVEKQRQATMPNDTLYPVGGFGHPTHTITTDLDGLTIKKATPSALVALVATLKHIPKLTTLVTEALVRANLPPHYTVPGTILMGKSGLLDISLAGTAYFSPAKSDQLLMNGINGNFVLDGSPIVENTLWDDDRIRAYGPEVGVFVDIVNMDGTTSHVTVENQANLNMPFSKVKITGWKGYCILIGGYFHQALAVIDRT